MFRLGVSGTLPVANGGTGSSTALTANSLIYASSTTAMTSSTNMTLTSMGQGTNTSNASNAGTFTVTTPTTGYASYFQASSMSAGSNLQLGVAGTGWNSDISGMGLVQLTGSATTLYYRNASSSTIATLSSTGIFSTVTLQPTNPLAAGYGGTGSTSAFVQGGIVYGSSTSALSTSAAGTAGYVLVSGGTGAPTWSASAPPSFSGLTSFAPIYASSTSSVASIGSTGTSGQALLSTGSSTAPAYGALNLSTSTNITSQLGVANGGTGLSTLTAGQFLYALTSSSIGTSPNVVINGNGNMTQTSNASAGAQFKVIPTSTSYAGFFAAASASSAAQLLMGIDGIGFSGTHGGQPIIQFTGTATTLYWQNASSTDIMLLSSTGALTPNSLTPANPVGASYGGTGSTSAFTQGGIVYGSSTSVLATSAAGTSGYVLISGGTGAPTWAATAPAGFSGLTTYAPIYATSATAVASLASTGTSGQPLLSADALGPPAYGALSLSTSTSVTGTLANTNGGTGQSSAFTQGGVVYGSSTTVLATSAAGTSGQILVSGGTGAPTWSAIASAFSGLTAGGAIYASSTTAIASTAAGTSGQPLLSGGAGAPSFGALSLGGSAVTGTLANTKGGTGNSAAFTQWGITYAVGSTQLGTSAAGTTGQVLVANTGSGPTWGSAASSFTGLTSGNFVYATSATTIATNPYFAVDANGNWVKTSVASTVSAMILKPATVGYGSYAAFQNSAGSNTLFVGLDGTGYEAFQTGQAVYVASGSATNHYFYSGSTNCLNISTSGLSILGGANLTYTEGTWTPTFTGANASVTVSGRTSNGTWKRWGNMVSVQFYLQCTGLANSGSATVVFVSGLSGGPPSFNPGYNCESSARCTNSSLPTFTGGTGINNPAQIVLFSNSQSFGGLTWDGFSMALMNVNGTTLFQLGAGTTSGLTFTIWGTLVYSIT